MDRGRHFLQVDPSRSTKGEATGKAKLTDDKVREIRSIYSRGGRTQYQIAADYGVCQRTINKVVNATGWSHVA